jgi:hypothetical protein
MRLDAQKAKVLNLIVTGIMIEVSDLARLYCGVPVKSKAYRASAAALGEEFRLCRFRYRHAFRHL